MKIVHKEIVHKFEIESFKDGICEKKNCFCNPHKGVGVNVTGRVNVHITIPVCREVLKNDDGKG